MKRFQLPAMFSPRTARAVRRHAGTDGRAFEALESRRVFSVDFAYAGIQYGATSQAEIAVVYGTGTRGDDGVVTGTRTVLFRQGDPFVGNIDIASMTFGPGGSMSITDTDGVHTTNPFGADFRMSSGYPVGFFSASPSVGDSSSGKLVRYFIEQRERNLDWFQSYSFSINQVMQGGINTIQAHLTFEFEQPMDLPWPNPRPVTAIISYDGGEGQRRNVTSISPTGVITLDSGEILSFTNNSNPYQHDDIYGMSTFYTATDLLYVDTNASDGVIGVGIGSSDAPRSLLGAVGGVYRGSVITSSTVAADFFDLPITGGQLVSVDFVLTMDEQGGFKMFTPAQFASNNPSPYRVGTWQASADSLVLTYPPFGSRAMFKVSSSGMLTAVSVSSGDGSITGACAGTLSQYVGTFNEKYGEVREVFLDGQGHANVYSWLVSSLNGEEVWAKFDLTARAGGYAMTSVNLVRHPSAIASSSSAYTDLVVGIDTRGHVVSYERAYGGDWRYRDITQELSASELVQSRTVFNAWKFDAYRLGELDQHIPISQFEMPVVFGVDAQGRLSLFRPTDDLSNTSAMQWQRIDLTTEVGLTGSPLPEFGGGEVAGFTSPWGSINIVGLNSTGEVEALWTSPGYGWYVNNLSEVAGADRAFLAGTLAPYWTTWHALNISGLDANGHINVLWWTPATSRWIASDLSETFTLEALDTTPPSNQPPKLITIINHDYSAMAIGGFDARGHVVMYWWTVGASGWQARDITPATADAELPVALDHGDVHGRGGTFSTDQSAWGVNSQGDIVRSRWTDIHGDVWTFENLTDLAISQE